MFGLNSLFQPINIGNMTLKNRLVMAPMHTGFAAPDGTVTEQLINYYVERAKGGVGLIITESSCVDTPEGRLGPKELLVDNDRYVPGLKQLVDVVHAAGAKISLQLNHAGRYARTSVQPVAPSAIPSRLTGVMPRELTTAEIEAIIEKFALAVERAKKAGFDAVELMGATGYLISEFHSPRTNKRKGRFGGDAAAMATFVVEILQSARSRVGSDFPISCKLSLSDYAPHGQTLEDSQIMARRFVEAGVSFFHAWAGWHESLIPMLPAAVDRGAWVHLAEVLKKTVSVPVIAVGRINEPQLADRIIAEGKADLVAMGRALLADPCLPFKAQNGQFADIRPCIACCRCFDNILTNVGAGNEYQLICTVNSELGKEGQKNKPTTMGKNVLIVGGGPAGMETARMAALRGHKVTLWEVADRLGGNLLPAAVPPFKEELDWLTDYFIHQIKTKGIQVELNKMVTPETIMAAKADVVIIATGASYALPDIPGIHNNNVVNAIEVLMGKKDAGEKVVVIGGGSIGCETAEYLLKQGKKVTIVARSSRLGNDIGPTTRWVTLKRLRDYAGINIFTDTQTQAITETGVEVVQNGITKNLEADTIVIARGMEPNRELVDALQGKVKQFHIIGDCQKVDKLLAAIHNGWSVGSTI